MDLVALASCLCCTGFEAGMSSSLIKPVPGQEKELVESTVGQLDVSLRAHFVMSWPRFARKLELLLVFDYFSSEGVLCFVKLGWDGKVKWPIEESQDKGDR